jgi:hypothetical protein
MSYWLIKQQKLKIRLVHHETSPSVFSGIQTSEFCLYFFFNDFIWRKMIELLFNILMVEFLC